MTERGLPPVPVAVPHHQGVDFVSIKPHLLFDEKQFRIDKKKRLSHNRSNESIATVSGVGVKSTRCYFPTPDVSSSMCCEVTPLF